jgi:hypothetical protein
MPLTFPATSLTGILGVVPSNPEVVGVFPQLSSTTIPHEQEIKIRRGDSLDLGVQVQDDDDPPSGVSLLTSAMRFAIRQGPGVPRSLLAVNQVANFDALVLKRSYLPTEIEYTDATNGQAIVHVRPNDTRALPQVPAIWDLELTRRVTMIDVSALRVNLVAGGDVAQAVNFSWIDLGVQAGDLFEAQGTVVLIVEVMNAVQLKTDFVNWTTATQTTFCLYTGNKKTIAAGPFTALGDVVI